MTRATFTHNNSLATQIAGLRAESRKRSCHRTSQSRNDGGGVAAFALMPVSPSAFSPPTLSYKTILLFLYKQESWVCNVRIQTRLPLRPQYLRRLLPYRHRQAPCWSGTPELTDFQVLGCLSHLRSEFASKAYWWPRTLIPTELPATC